MSTDPNAYQEAMKKWLDQNIAETKKNGKKSRKKSEKLASSVVDFISLLKASMKKTNKIRQRP